MLQNLAVAWSLATLPVRALYTGYRGLAWVFDSPFPSVRAVQPSAARPPAATPGQPTPEPQPLDALPAIGLPDKSRNRLLKLGFTASTLMWVPIAYGAAVAVDQRWVDEPRAWMGAAWIAGVAWIVSLLAIKRAGGREAAARAASPLARARRAVGGVVGAVVEAPARVIAGVRAAPERAADAAKRVPERAANVAGSALRVAGRFVESSRARVAGWAKTAPVAAESAPK